MLGTQRMRSQPALQRLIILVTVLAGLFVASNAAADRVQWVKRSVDEGDGWNLSLKFYLNRPPDIPHVPMRFEFQNTVYYERTLVDGKDKPVERRVPLEFKSPLIETVDVGFLDPSSGKTQKGTSFRFKLTRGRGFEAGEYKVTVLNKRTGKKLGGAITLKLNGENEVIDRRSMVFAEKKKKEKKEEKEPENQEPDPSQDPNSEEYWASGPTEAEGDGDALPPPAHMQNKPGACGCRVTGEKGGSYAGLFLLMAMVGAPLLRRRRA